MTNSFKDIKAWQYAHQFVLDVYKAVRQFPAEERFALSSQFLRAAVSIPANIAEGYKRLSKQEKLRFMNISQGSLEECRCYIILSCDLSYINQSECDSLIQEIEETSKFLNSYSVAIVTKKKWED